MQNCDVREIVRLYLVLLEFYRDRVRKLRGHCAVGVYSPSGTGTMLGCARNRNELTQRGEISMKAIDLRELRVGYGKRSGKLFPHDALLIISCEVS